MSAGARIVVVGFGADGSGRCRVRARKRRSDAPREPLTAKSISRLNHLVGGGRRTTQAGKLTPAEAVAHSRGEKTGETVDLGSKRVGNRRKELPTGAQRAEDEGERGWHASQYHRHAR
jgi:hypothetical protein